MHEPDLIRVVRLAKEMLSMAIGEDHFEAWKNNKHYFNNNLYEYMQVFNKQDVSDIFKVLKSFLRKTSFDDLNKPQYKYEMNVLYTVFNMAAIWKAIETQEDKGKQHTYPQFLAKSYWNAGFLNVLDLERKIRYRANHNYILCYEEKIYSDALERYYGIIESEYAGLDFSPTVPLTLYQRFVISLFVGTLSSRSPESAIAYYREHGLLENRDKDDDMNIAFDIASQSFHKILLNRWLFVETGSNRFPFFLGPPNIYNKKDSESYTYGKAAMSFSLTPTLKLMLPQSERNLMDSKLSELVGARLYKHPLGHVAYVSPSDSLIIDRVSKILVEYDILSASMSVSKLLIFSSDINAQTVINPYFDFADFIESPVRKILGNKLGGIEAPHKMDSGIVKVLRLR